MPPYERARERRLLEELSRINNDYGTRQREAMQQLARSRHELAAAHGVLGAVAHDLRTPLQAVLGFAEFLLDEDLDPHQQELVDRISRAAQQMSRLTEELLDTLTEGGPSLDVRPVDLAALVEDVVTRHALMDRGDAVTVRSDLRIAPGTAVVNGDPARLQRVLENLVGNAVKFSPADGIVTVSVRVEDDAVCLAVTDQGPGIDPAEQARVFEPFQRTAAATGVPGVGLGLAIVRQIVERHGGSVGVASVPGRGATFTVRLPRA